jgi:hypothetical protein
MENLFLKNSFICFIWLHDVGHRLANTGSINIMSTWHSSSNCWVTWTIYWIIESLLHCVRLHISDVEPPQVAGECTKPRFSRQQRMGFEWLVKMFLTSLDVNRCCQMTSCCSHTIIQLNLTDTSSSTPLRLRLLNLYVKTLYKIKVQKDFTDQKNGICMDKT